MYDAVIIGCGITGAAAAFELSKYQLKVAVLEAENDVAQGATKANSAILHAGYDPKPGTLMAKLNVRGVELARELCARLDVPYRQNGAMVLGFSEEDKATLQELYEQGQINGVKELKILTGDEARALEPNLAPEVVAALHVPTSAVCLPWEYCLALAETAVVNGVELYLEQRVTGLTKTEEGWKITTDKGEFESRYVINAAGIFACDVQKMVAPADWEMKTARGEYFLMDKGEGARVDHTIFQCPSKVGKGVLVSPTVHGNLIVGPDSCPVTGNDVSNTASGLAFVRSTATRSVPSVDFRQSIRNFAGVRAHGSTGDFIIGPVEGAPGFFNAAGICSPGLSAAPAIAEYLVGLMGEAGLPLEKKADFKCERHCVRFRLLPDSRKAAVVAENPSYGRVICRCETITEGEILAAIHSPIPPRSVDGVKRRAGSGLGRCQGGFCGPRVVELLCRELGYDPSEILQDRAGSYMLVEETKGGAQHV